MVKTACPINRRKGSKIGLVYGQMNETTRRAARLRVALSALAVTEYFP